MSSDDCATKIVPTCAPVIFGVPFFARELVKIAARYGIQVHYQHNLVAVDGPGKTATFEKVSEQDKGERTSARSACWPLISRYCPSRVARIGPVFSARRGAAAGDQFAPQMVSDLGSRSLNVRGRIPGPKLRTIEAHAADSAHRASAAASAPRDE
jgi:hypothetical protein